MNRNLFALLIVLALTACGSPGPVASIEDHNQPNKEAVSDKGNGTDSTSAASPSASTAADKGVTAESLPNGASSGGTNEQLSTEGGASGKNVDPRKDPASPLSKRSIYFDFDSDVIKDDYQIMIEAHAAYLVARKDAKVTLQGNTDARGSREFNLALGQRRAEAVRKALSVLGVSDAQMEAVSFGEEKPRAVGDTDQDYAENRRVDIVYSDE